VWAKRWTGAKGKKFTPAYESSTTTIIVPIVTVPKTQVTTISSNHPPFTAGYIRIGIKGSHGPKTKMVNNIHGVILTAVVPL
jgi:hypothetical protein